MGGSSPMWDGVERRQGTWSLAQVEDAFDRGLREHERREKEFVDGKIDMILRAFPEGLEAHREGHLAQARAAHAQEEFYRSLKEDLAKKSIWGILQIFAFFIIAGVAAKFGINLASLAFWQ